MTAQKQNTVRLKLNTLSYKFKQKERAKRQLFEKEVAQIIGYFL